MIKKILVITFYLTTLYSTAQLVNPVEIPFDKITDFNKDYIKEKRLKSVVLSYSSKMDGDIIIRHGIEKQYLFNTDGEPISEVYIEEGETGTDSLISFFEFNEQFKLTQQIDRYKNQLIKKLYFYNKAGRLKKEVTIEIKDNKTDTSAITNYKEPYSEATFAKRLILNSENRPFIEQRLYYDQQLRLINKEEDLYITSRSRKTSWLYDGTLLKEISYNDQINGNSKGKYAFEYNRDQLEYLYHYEKDELIKKTAFVYAVNNPNLLEALVIRHPKKGNITIMTIKYEYH